jgi:beta-galactosidase GanA
MGHGFFSHHISIGLFLVRGVAYYPEQWPEARWDADLARIAQTGMNVVRMGEGAWSIWEPEEGRYDLRSSIARLSFVRIAGSKRSWARPPTHRPPGSQNATRKCHA